MRDVIFKECNFVVFEVNWSSAKIKFHWKILWVASVRKQYIVYIHVKE